MSEITRPQPEDNRRQAPKVDRRGGSCQDTHIRDEYFACIEPVHRGMGNAHRDQPVKERVCGIVLDKMVGQNSLSALRAHGSETPRPQVFHQTTQRRFFPDKPATALPGNEVDMDIHLDDAQCPRRGASRSAREIAVRPQRASKPKSEASNRFHGGTRTGSARVPNKSARRARPAASSDATSGLGRSAGNSLFFPTPEWFKCRQPC